MGFDRSSGHNAMGYHTFFCLSSIGIHQRIILLLRAGWKRAYPNLLTRVPGRSYDVESKERLVCNVGGRTKSSKNTVGYQQWYHGTGISG